MVTSRDAPASGAKTEHAVSVIVDDRESRGGLLQHLRSIKGLAVQVGRLPVGDCRIAERVVVERKTLRDLAASVVDGRLLSQASRMAASNLRPVLIIEGVEQDLRGLGVRREAIQGALVAVSVVFGIAVLRARDIEESARLVSYVGRQVVAQAQGGLPRPGWRPRGKRRRQIYVLQGLPGVGPRRAMNLLEVFGNVQAVITADANRLMEVEGIGPRTAAGIRAVVE